MKAVVSLSGGMDSATTLAWACKRAEAVLAVGFLYGSKHNPYEQACAEQLAKHYGVEFIQIDLSNVGAHLKSNLLESGGDIPEGHYEDETMKQTVVPGRNMIFTSILAGIAESRGFDTVVLGVHSGDHAIYPDCRPEFVTSMSMAVYDATDKKVEITAPFLYDDKTKILAFGFEAGVPYEMTRTCYKQQRHSCGKCGSCQERLEAFRNIGRKDPITYED